MCFGPKGRGQQSGDRKGTHLTVLNYFKNSGHWAEGVPEHEVPHPGSETWKELSNKGEVKA